MAKKALKKVSKKVATSEAEIGEYQGKPVMQLFNLDGDGKRLTKFVFSFGKKKAQLIMAHLDEIKKFAEEE